VYPENEQGGFYDFDLAPSILEFFVDYIAPYPFSTLANVQSTTRFGGMENAGCIFYDENAINGTRSSEALLAHEIAHQWFGNSATEKDWPHLWLSEGFATYLTLIYQEKVKGGEVFKQELEQDKKQIIAFSKSYPNPVIDSTQKDLMKLLNANSYQKGSWVLHMLRKKVGDEVFQKIIQSYYSTYKLSNASSTDFERIAEEISGMELTTFFNQWLRKPGIPQLSARLSIKKKNLTGLIIQLQNYEVYEFPLQLKINFSDESSIIETIIVSEKVTRINKRYSKKISSFVLDPNVELLFEEVR
jgi:aminopeptidase N